MKTQIQWKGETLTVEHSGKSIIDIRDNEGNFVSIGIKDQHKIMNKI